MPRATNRASCETLLNTMTNNRAEN